MKNLYRLFLVLFLFVNIALCGFSADENSIKFLDKNYSLTYSIKVKSGGYINEYTLNNQSVSNWSEMIVVHHFPKSKSPLNEAKEVSNFITAYYAKQNQKAPVSIMYNDKKNSAMVDFILPVQDKNTKKLKNLEFNIFKYEMAKDGNGVVAIQYSKKFFANELLQETQFQQNLEKVRKSAINAMTTMQIPEIVNREIK